MNLEEFRKALSSDATEENGRLKKQLSDLQTEYHEISQNSKAKMIHSKKAVEFYVIDALLLQKGLLAYFVVSIILALICLGLKSRRLWLIN